MQPKFLQLKLQGKKSTFNMIMAYNLVVYLVLLLYYHSCLNICCILMTNKIVVNQSQYFKSFLNHKFNIIFEKL